MNEPKRPPIHLVKTWVWMMMSSDDEEVRASGQEKLIAAFGSLAKAQAFLVEHQLV